MQLRIDDSTYDLFIAALLTHLPLLGVFIALLAAGLGLPLPEDLSLLTAGYLCWHGDASLAAALPVAYAGIVIGDSSLYWIGRVFGPRLTRHPFLARHLSADRLARIAGYYRRHGSKLVLLARFAAGARGGFFFCAGAMRMSYARFLFFDLIAAAGSVTAWVLIGRRFGGHIDRVRQLLRHTEHWAMAGALIAICVWLVIRQRRRGAKARLAQASTPAL